MDPATLVLIRRLDCHTKLLRSVDRPMRVSDQGTREEYDVRPPVPQVRFSLLGLGDHPNGANRKPRVRLLQGLSERCLIRVIVVSVHNQG